jgi:thiamine-phosphate pyrophosphorylase
MPSMIAPSLIAITDRSAIPDLFAITDRKLAAPGHQPGRLLPQEQAWLVARAHAWAAGGVDWVQLREKDLPPEELLALARALREVFAGTKTRLLLNGAAELALAAAADGVHLPGGWAPPSIAHARQVLGTHAVISVACHSWQTPREARDSGADMALFSPIFSAHKPIPGSGGAAPPGLNLPGLGVEALRRACAEAAPLRVYALGGITAGNAALCRSAGAAGVAAIRLFAGDEWTALAQAEGHNARPAPVDVTRCS